MSTKEVAQSVIVAAVLAVPWAVYFGFVMR